jgi:hypothetical protein
MNDQSRHTHATLSCRTPIMAVVLALLNPLAWSQEYKIDASTIDSGGGKSAGGRFKVEGTIGQPDAGTSSGGRYRIDGGFWPGGVQAVQVAGLPNLKIKREGKNTVVLTWEDAGNQFNLQESESLKASGWSTTSHSIQTKGATRSIILTGVTSRLFFRLSKK